LLKYNAPLWDVCEGVLVVAHVSSYAAPPAQWS